jgi:hypothetical protein
MDDEIQRILSKYARYAPIRLNALRETVEIALSDWNELVRLSNDLSNRYDINDILRSAEVSTSIGIIQSQVRDLLIWAKNDAESQLEIATQIKKFCRSFALDTYYGNGTTGGGTRRMKSGKSSS